MSRYQHMCQTVAGLCALSLVAVGCGRSAQQTQAAIKVMGSDTMVNLCQAWAEAFMAQHPDVFVSVTGGGSGTGIAAFINGTCDIAAASREMKSEEIALARQRGVEPVEHVVGLDGIAVVVHPDNPVTQLTMDQLRGIFMGTITNWQEVGGDSAPIVLLSREVNSGTHVFFKEHVLRRGNAKGSEEFAPSALLLSSSQAIADEVAQNRHAIGYYGMGYISPRQKALAVAKAAGQPYVAPATASVLTGAYPIARPLLCYTPAQPSAAVTAFLSFIASPEGHAIVTREDFVPPP